MDNLVLRVIEGNAAGTEVPLDGDVLLGRSAGRPGNLGNDATLSRRHARIHAAADGGLVLEDLGSHNGTRVNGELISVPRALAAGDLIELGETTLELIAVGTEAEPVAAEPAPREQATRLGQVPVEAEPVAAEPARREQATRLGRVPVEAEPPAGEPTPGDQATRLGRVPVEPEPEPVADGSWGAHAAPPTRVGPIPEEILAAGAPREQATRLRRVSDEPAPPPAGESDQATRLAPVPIEPAVAEPPAAAPPVGRVVPEASPPPAAEEAPRLRWWQRILRRPG